MLEYLAVFLGPNPPQTLRAKPESTARKSGPDPAELYLRHCAGCHLENGRGVADRFPPLAGNPYLRGNPLYTVRVILFGLEGEIEIAGRKFQGRMPGFSQLADSEIAALANYVGAAWGKPPQESMPTGEVARERKPALEPEQVRLGREK